MDVQAAVRGVKMVTYDDHSHVVNTVRVQFRGGGELRVAPTCFYTKYDNRFPFWFIAEAELLPMPMVVIGLEP